MSNETLPVTISDMINVAGKKCLISIDHSKTENGIIATANEIKKLSNAGAKVVVFISKDTRFNDKSLPAYAHTLSKIIDQQISCYVGNIDRLYGTINKMTNGKIILLDKLFHNNDEISNNEQMAKKLSLLCDIYVCDSFDAFSFGCNDYKFASVFGITKMLNEKYMAEVQQAENISISEVFKLTPESDNYPKIHKKI